MDCRTSFDHPGSHTGSHPGTRARIRSSARAAERREPRTRSRSRSPRPERRRRDSDQQGDRHRWRDHDGYADRERVRDEGSGERERSSKRQRTGHGHGHGGERGDGRSHRHHHRHEPSNRHHRHHSARQGADESKPPPSSKELPFAARQLSRSDLAVFRPLLAYYLDLQKTLDITSLDEIEVRGRWKSFMGKWNRGELAEGWYDPEIFQRAVHEYPDIGPGLGLEGEGEGPITAAVARPSPPPPPPKPIGREDSVNEKHNNDDDKEDEEDDDDDTYGPPPPPPGGSHPNPYPSSTPNITGNQPPGPSIPTQTDLTLRDEALTAAREADLSSHRLARTAHRREQRALLDELVPRADAGTRERRLEKRKEVNDKMRAFRDKSPGGEVAEGELMGGGSGGGDAMEEYKALVGVREERKRERVSRREEMERARRAERDERVRGYREREERVVEGLRELARARFGVP